MKSYINIYSVGTYADNAIQNVTDSQIEGILTNNLYLEVVAQRRLQRDAISNKNTSLTDQLKESMQLVKDAISAVQSGINDAQYSSTELIRKQAAVLAVEWPKVANRWNKLRQNHVLAYVNELIDFLSKETVKKALTDCNLLPRLALLESRLVQYRTVWISRGDHNTELRNGTSPCGYSQPLLQSIKLFSDYVRAMAAETRNSKWEALDKQLQGRFLEYKDASKARPKKQATDAAPAEAPASTAKSNTSAAKGDVA